MQLAEKELVQKCFQLNPHHYDGISFILGFVIAGNKARKYMIQFKGKCENGNLAAILDQRLF